MRLLVSPVTAAGIPESDDAAADRVRGDRGDVDENRPVFACPPGPVAGDSLGELQETAPYPAPLEPPPPPAPAAPPPGELCPAPELLSTAISVATSDPSNWSVPTSQAK